MTNVDLLKQLEATQASNESYDFRLGKRIVLLKHEIETGNRICPTCEGAADSGSPCGHCGVGMREI